MLHVGGEKDTSEVIFVSLEGADGDYLSRFVSLDHTPDVHVALQAE